MFETGAPTGRERWNQIGLRTKVIIAIGLFMLGLALGIAVSVVASTANTVAIALPGLIVCLLFWLLGDPPSDRASYTLYWAQFLVVCGAGAFASALVSTIFIAC